MQKKPKKPAASRPAFATNIPAARPALRFSPTAWAKLLFLRDYGQTEVGGFGISREDDLLMVEDIQLVPQQCTVASVEFDDEAVADFFDEQVDQGRQPDQFARLWIHTHPGDSARPSNIDEDTFQRCFGSAHWAVMFILACGGETYARLRFNVGPGGSIKIPVEVAYDRAFAAADHDAWEAEYLQNVMDENRYAANVLDERWETTDLPERFLEEWAEYVGDDAPAALVASDS